MPGPDLTAATAKVESLMDDEIRFWRDAEGPSDSELDPLTGRLEAPADDGADLYSGKCMFRLESSTEVREGDILYTLLKYRVTLPLTVPQLQVGDQGMITASRRDAESVGLVMRISEPPEYKTFTVSRKVTCEAKVKVNDRP